jgi:uncharacterized OB-fold protein
MPVRFRYTPGVGNGAFFSALAERGVFVGSRCGDCAITYLPTRTFCERCLGALEPDTECGPEGTLESWTVAHRDVDDEPLDPPIAWGLVRLDGADTVLLHRLLRPADIGSRVRPVVRADRTSSILDLEGFEPA